MNKNAYIFYMMLITLPLIAIDLPQQELLKQICSYNGRKTFLLSYPRSGSTWMRYCLEYLTGRPTIYRPFLAYENNSPLGWNAGFEIDWAKPPIEKMHNKREMKKQQYDSENDLLILIIRNPKEALSRQEKQQLTFALLSKNAGTRSQQYAPDTYFINIGIYDSWKPENRLLIYYEDLLVKPAQTLTKALLFLHEPLNRLDNFINEYEAHKQKAIEIYKVSESEGNDLLFHSRLINPDHRKQIDEWMSQLYPLIWQEYLKERYAEKNLDY